ncbi:Uma2 family endonuclease [Alkalinema pantanalense CENA528]|uniref:Uma2 family endonuclease n=1 Tax=Alkalinema pantanalense TaxID=1620705 RepID=UPI003D6F2B6A
MPYPDRALTDILLVSKAIGLLSWAGIHYHGKHPDRGRLSMTYTPQKTLTFDEFIAQYGDEPRYELIDGELRDMDPTGPHEAVAGKVGGWLFAEILRARLNWFIPKGCLIKPPATEATALRPDVIVLDEELIQQEPLWQREPIITRGSTIKLVVEVVSTNWQDDYARKVEEYALLGIPEYWIVDYRGLGGLAFIGKPKRPTLTVYYLDGDDYRATQYHLGEPIASPLFPNLQLRLDDLLPR